MGDGIVMDLNIKDRLFLYNQYEILKKLNSEESKKYEVMQAIVANGFKHNYGELITGFVNEMPESISQFVFDVLQMYRVLNASLCELSPEQKRKINVKDITYAGFDGNEESSYYTYANFVLKDLGRFEEIYNDGKVELNSHKNMFSKYNRMVTTWKEAKTGRYNSLSYENIIKVINDKYLFKAPLV